MTPYKSRQQCPTHHKYHIFSYPPERGGIHNIVGGHSSPPVTRPDCYDQSSCSSPCTCNCPSIIYTKKWLPPAHGFSGLYATCATIISCCMHVEEYAIALDIYIYSACAFNTLYLHLLSKPIQSVHSTSNLLVHC